MFGNSGNNNHGVSVNTPFYSSATDTSLLTVGGWNKSISIKYSPATGKDSLGVTQYSQENGQQILTAITQENAIALLEGYKDLIVPAIKDGTEAKVTIEVGRNETKKALSVGYTGKDAYLEIAANVDENGVAPEDSVVTHTFRKKSYMSGYDAKTGSGKEVPTEADLYNFIAKIEACQDLIPTVAHSIKHDEAQKASRQGANNYNQNQNNYSAPTNTTTGLDDFPF
jgi:hypothetical protein